MVVSEVLTHNIDKAKTLRFIALSIALNLSLASAINPTFHQSSLQNAVSLRVSLNSLSSKSVQQVEQKKVKNDVNHKNFVTTQNAKTSLTKKNKEEKLIAAKKSVEKNGINKGNQVSSVIHEPNYRHQTPPIYPKRALDLGWQGIVTLHAKLSKDGLPKELKIAKSSGYKILDMAAFSAVKQWEFEPLNINGNIQESWVRVPVRFVIN